ncbi:hypothetical protein [Haliscomenobacter sp.]|uniref:hypothetical protein n=1 Tax=Haliscomenobacter sp. TaxID=2717303 RepID=UPI003BABB8F7
MPPHRPGMPARIFTVLVLDPLVQVDLFNGQEAIGTSLETYSSDSLALAGAQI